MNKSGLLHQLQFRAALKNQQDIAMTVFQSIRVKILQIRVRNCSIRVTNGCTHRRLTLKWIIIRAVDSSNVYIYMGDTNVNPGEISDK